MDVDGDGVSRTDGDCDDHDDSIGGPNGFYRDIDGDGFGAGAEELYCDQPEGYSIFNTDCDDTEDTVHPGADEICNEIDDDCDEETDEGVTTRWFHDDDEDTYGDPDDFVDQCDEPDGYVTNDLDCDDTDNAINPDAEEVCDDGIDQDCNGQVDDTDDAIAWWLDADADSYGDPDEIFYTCAEDPEGYVDNDLDCDDTDYDVNPSVEEACNDGIDNNCNGITDDDAEDVEWYRDADEDGFGNPDDTTIDCAPPSGYVANTDDCDDTDEDVNPDAEEVCNDGIDNDCDESPGDCALSGTYTAADADVLLEGDESALYTETAVNVGDINNDGYEDLMVGVPFAGANNNGAALLFYGPITTTSLTHADADVEWVGTYDNDYAGYAIAGVGDVNGDTYNDILIGAYGEGSGGTNAGMAYLIYGSGSLSGGDLNYADRKWRGAAADDHLGYTLSGAGDINADGYDDMLIGAIRESTEASYAGATYLILGSSGLLEGSVEGVAAAKWTGEDADNFAGIGLSGQCDINADGYDDVIIGATGNSSAATEAGAAYLILGSSSPTSGSLSGADAKWTGEALEDLAGRAVTCQNDVNADGYDDVIIGAYGEDTGGSIAGAAYLILGSSSPTSGSLSGADAKWTGVSAGGYAGFSVSNAGDINADGYDDLLIGAYLESSIFSNGGASYLILGSSSPTSGSLSGADANWTAEAEGDKLGTRVASCGDINFDGYDDLLFTAPYTDVTHQNAGMVYIVYGLGY